MKLFIVSLLLIGISLCDTDACTVGCLRCDVKTKLCDVCDFRNNYVRSAGGSCELGVIPNCSKADATGGCYECASDYYYDPTSKTCIGITTAIQECRTYSGPATCATCTSGFYKASNVCVFIAVNARISKCVVYSSISTCSDCSTGFIPGVDRTSCRAGNVNNCDLYRNYYCNRCDTSVTVVNRNSYLATFYDNDNKDDMNSVALRLFNGPKFTSIISICVETVISNCSTFISYNKCFLCDSGYYVETDGSCEPYVETDLTGCVIFSNATTCSSCDSDYYYLDNGDCVLVTPVQDCSKYSAAADSCAICSSDFYLTGGSCTARTQTVTLCFKYVVDKDECEECSAGNQLSTDGLSCFDLPDNCALAATDLTTCLKCNDGYFVGASGCEIGTDTNCEKFATSSDTCVLCDDDFALDSVGACVARVSTIDNCVEYLAALPDRCDTCDFKSERFEQTSICDFINEIDNCAIYTDTDNCQKCDPSYELSSNACNPIDASENCVEKSNSLCILCADGYELVSDLCVAIPQQYTENCAVADPLTVGVTFDCIGCADTAIPIDNIGEICVEASTQYFATIDNCAKYTKNQDNSYSCNHCVLGYSLSKDGDACLGSCPTGQVEYAGEINIDGNNITVEPFSKCHELSDFIDLPTGCLVASRELKGNNNFCLKCDDDSIPIESCALNNTFFNVDDPSNLIEGQAFSVVGCQAIPTGATFYPSSNGPDANCQHYTPFGTKFYCSQCKFGYTGAIQIDGDRVHYINCSVLVDGCNQDVRIGSGFADESWLADMYGFSLTYNFTCHVCTDATKIPFIHLNNLGGLLEYQLNNTDDIPAQSTTKDGEMTVCRAPTAAGLNASAAQFTAFVDNCALGLVVVDITKNITSGASSVRCLACKDGYKKVLDATSFYIESCEAIANCDSQPTTGWFEGCKSCDSTHAKIVSAAGVIDPNDCSTVHSDPNCRIYDSTNSTCAHCERGYYLDAADKCIELDIPFCPGYAQRSTLSFKVPDEQSQTGETVQNYGYAYYFGMTGFECFQCNEDFVSVAVTNDNELCALYPDIANGTSNYLIANCDTYYLNDSGDFRCRHCAPGFIIDTSNVVCHSSGSLTGCAIAADNGTSCETCASGYQIGNAACLVHNIDDCVTYGYENSQLVCTVCALEYFLDTNTCVEGTVENCGTYNTVDSCETCLNGFYLLANACLPIPADTNCDQVTLVKGTPSTFTCNSCKANYITNSTITSSEYTICLEGPLTTNCSEYDDDFVCQACESTHYLNNDDSCVLRVLSDANCTNYKSDADECEVCAAGYYIVSGSCVKNIYSTAFCKYYSFGGNCLFCNNSRYVGTDVQCLVVGTNQKVTNCLLYKTDQTCFQCVTSFVLIEGLCFTPIAANCAQYTNDKVCASCPSGYYFKVRTEGTDKIRDCLALTIDNCLELNPLIGNCKVCAKGFFPRAGACVAAANPIANCLVSKANSCEVCDKGYVKTSNNNSCVIDTGVSSVEPNCVDLRFNNTPVCTACRTTQFFSGPTCTSCYSNDAERSTYAGCRYCQPTDKTKCLICNPSYYMNSSGVCLASPAASGLTSMDDDDDYDESTSILSSLMLLISVFFVLIQ